MSEDILELPPPPPGERLAYGSDPNQFGELRLPIGPGPHPTVIFIHGGFWKAKYDLAHGGHLCAAVTRAGYATWSLEYRRTGQRGGGYPGTLEDIRAGARHLTKIPGIDLKKVVVAGHSAGGQLALWLAAQGALELKAVIALAPVTDLRQAKGLNLGGGAGGGAVAAFLGEDPEAPGACSPIELLPINISQTLLHGIEDDIVPFDQSRAFAKASGNAQLIALPGTGHFELIDPRSSVWATVLHHLSLK